MKTALWEQSPGALASLINSKSFVFGTLYTITLFGTQGVIRLTDADVDIAFNGISYSSKGPFIDVGNSKAIAHWKRGLDVDTWVVVILPRRVDVATGEDYPDKIGSVPWIAAARGGAISGADIQVDRAYFPAWPQPWRPVATPTGVLTIFAGRAAEVDTTDTLVALTINDYRELLTQPFPPNVWQAGCRHTLYDAGCTLNPATFAQNGALVGGSTRSVLACPLPVPGGSGTYQLGKVTITSGLNQGFSRTVRQWDQVAQMLYLVNPLPFDVTPGDELQAVPGCDKQQATCTKFGNKPNYGGEDYVPDATTAV